MTTSTRQTNSSAQQHHPTEWEQTYWLSAHLESCVTHEASTAHGCWRCRSGVGPRAKLAYFLARGPTLIRALAFLTRSAARQVPLVETSAIRGLASSSAFWDMLLSSIKIPSLFMHPEKRLDPCHAFHFSMRPFADSFDESSAQ